MTDSILNSTKINLGINEDDDSFDLEIMTHINSVMLTLDQIGVGPVGGFLIEDAEAEWWDLLGEDPRLNAVKTLVWAKVKMLFDVPGTSFHINALQEQIREMEYRLTVHMTPEPDYTLRNV